MFLYQEAVAILLFLIGMYDKKLEKLKFKSLCISQAALEDTKHVLGINKENVKAILNKAESLYNISDFEHALVQFHKGKVKFLVNSKTISTLIS